MFQTHTITGSLKINDHCGRTIVGLHTAGVRLTVLGLLLGKLLPLGISSSALVMPSFVLGLALGNSLPLGINSMAISPLPLRLGLADTWKDTSRWNSSWLLIFTNSHWRIAL
jgi:hypothetical protein